MAPRAPYASRYETHRRYRDRTPYNSSTQQLQEDVEESIHQIYTFSSWNAQLLGSTAADAMNETIYDDAGSSVAEFA
eukprot:6175808-Pleurochrysis_carterae.AAC.1